MNNNLKEPGSRAVWSSGENIPDGGTAGAQAQRLECTWCVHRTAGDRHGWSEADEGAGWRQMQKEGVGGFGGVTKGFVVLVLALTFAPGEQEL